MQSVEFPVVIEEDGAVNVDNMPSQLWFADADGKLEGAIELGGEDGTVMLELLSGSTTELEMLAGSVGKAAVPVPVGIMEVAFVIAKGALLGGLDGGKVVIIPSVSMLTFVGADRIDAGELKPYVSEGSEAVVMLAGSVVRGSDAVELLVSVGLPRVEFANGGMLVVGVMRLPVPFADDISPLMIVVTMEMIVVPFETIVVVDSEGEVVGTETTPVSLGVVSTPLNAVLMVLIGVVPLAVARVVDGVNRPPVPLADEVSPLLSVLKTLTMVVPFKISVLVKAL